MGIKSVLWEKRLMASVAVYSHGYIFFFNEQQNVLMKLNPQDWNVEIICDLRGYDPDNDSATGHLIMDENTIYKLELAGKRVLACNLENKLCKYVEIGCHYQDWGNFAGFAKYKDNLYIFPRFLRDITKVSTISWKVLKVEQSYLYNQDISETEEVFFCSVQREHDMWLFSRSKRIVIQYDMRDDSAHLKFLPEEIQFCIDVVVEDDDFYILDTNNSVFKWNVEKNSADLQWKNLYSSQMKMEFGKLIVMKNRFIIMPSLGSNILIINRENNEMMINEIYPDDFQYVAPENWAKYINFCEDDKHFYFPMRSANYILTIDKEEGMLSWHKPHFSNLTDYYLCLKKYSKKVMIENDLKLEDFFMYIVEFNYKKNRNSPKSLGNEIYRNLS